MARCEIAGVVIQFIWRARIAASAMFILILHCTTILAQNGEGQAKEDTIPITADQCNDMKLHKVLNSGAPVGCERLRLVKFRYFGFDGQLRSDGEIVVMDAVADHVSKIFDELRTRQFPVAKARLMNHYNGDDEASMADNNTSALNVREIAGGGPLSVHAFGLAIDVNPVQNPYIRRARGHMSISPKSGGEFIDRKNLRPGMVETIVGVFAEHGFLVWGGRWTNPIDYQHFEVNKGLVDQLARASPKGGEVLFNQYVDRYHACRDASAAGQIAGRRSCY